MQSDLFFPIENICRPSLNGLAPFTENKVMKWFFIGLFCTTIAWASPVEVGQQFIVVTPFVVSVGADSSKLIFLPEGAKIEVTAYSPKKYWAYQIKLIDEEGNYQAETYSTQKRFMLMEGAVRDMGKRTALVSPDLKTPKKIKHKKFQHPLKNPAMGARKVMAALYQSCHALTPTLTYQSQIENVVDKDKKGRRFLSSDNLDNYIHSHYILKDLLKLNNRGEYPTKNCRNVLESPPIYAFGAKPFRSKQKIYLFADLSEKDYGCRKNGISCSSSSVTGLDCSGFVSSAFSASGLKFDRDPSQQDKDPMPISTYWLADRPRHQTSCLEYALDNNKDTIRSGDLVNLKGNHVIIVESPGGDPLGVRKTLRGGFDCRDITVNDFDFTYIHSGGAGSFGVSRVHSSYHIKHKSILFNNLVQHAVELCEQMKDHLHTPAGITRRPDFSVLRHQSDLKSCHYGRGPRAILGEECVSQCL